MMFYKWGNKMEGEIMGEESADCSSEGQKAHIES
jgi:hypothetical protein